MTRRSRIWWTVAAVFTLVNLGGAVFAAAAGERLHCAGHVVLFLAGAFVMWWIPARARRRELAAPDVSGERLSDDRLDQLQQSVDAVAIEVERLGEAQRFRDKLRAERGQTSR